MLYSLSINFLVTRLNVLAATGWALRAAREGLSEAEAEVERPIIALDGKTSKGSKRNKTDRDAVKVRDVIKMLNVRGSVLTWDALGL